MKSLAVPLFVDPNQLGTREKIFQAGTKSHGEIFSVNLCCCWCCFRCCRCRCCCHCCCCCCCRCCHNFNADTKISYFQTDKAQNFFAVFGKRCFKSRLGKKLETMTGGSIAAKCSIGCKYLLLSNLSWIIFLREKSLPKKVNSVILYSHVASCD